MGAGRVRIPGRPEDTDYKPIALAAVGALQRTMSPTGTGTVARKAKVTSHQASRALKDLEKQGFVRVQAKSDHGNPIYEVTKSGWDKLGQQPPLWAA